MDGFTLPEWMTQLGPGAAALLALVWVVHRFLTHVEASDKRQGEREAKLIEVLDNLRESLDSGRFCRAQVRPVA